MDRPGDYARRRTVKDLAAPGRFQLIAGEHSHAWCEPARQLAAEADVPLDALRIGHLDGDCHDPRCAWQRHRQIASGGLRCRPALVAGATPSTPDSWPAAGSTDTGPIAGDIPRRPAICRAMSLACSRSFSAS
jgi:hypothetical protein